MGLSFWTFFRNSLLITVSSVVLASALSLLARSPWPGSGSGCAPRS